jgi:hypothetical protein
MRLPWGFRPKFLMIAPEEDLDSGATVINPFKSIMDPFPGRTKPVIADEKPVTDHRPHQLAVPWNNEH